MVVARLAQRSADFRSPDPFAEGLASLSRGDVETGYGLLRDASARYPDDPKGPSFLGMVEFQSGRYENAIASFRAASFLAPGVSAYSCNEGLACLLAGRPAEALDAFLRSLHGDAILIDAHRFAWSALAGVGKLDAASRTLKAALRERPAPAARTAGGPDLRDVTLCIVDCLDPLLAARSLRHSMAHARFGSVKLLTSLAFEAPGIETVRIPPITSLPGYSRFVIKDLGGYLDTDFALVTQWDGHVINADAWSETFKQFDYIGGVWDANVVPSPDGTIAYNVGNGGFSLRSAQFMDAGRDSAIVEIHPEDARLCQTYRPYLEDRYAIRFADEATAQQFSFEAIITESTPFGFHGLMNVCVFEPDPRFVRFDFLGDAQPGD